jgi:hypothetical protein
MHKCTTCQCFGHPNCRDTTQQPPTPPNWKCHSCRHFTTCRVCRPPPPSRQTTPSPSLSPGTSTQICPQCLYDDPPHTMHKCTTCQCFEHPNCCDTRQQPPTPLNWKCHSCRHFTTCRVCRPPPPSPTPSSQPSSPYHHPSNHAPQVTTDPNPPPPPQRAPNSTQPTRSRPPSPPRPPPHTYTKHTTQPAQQPMQLTRHTPPSPRQPPSSNNTTIQTVPRPPPRAQPPSPPPASRPGPTDPDAPPQWRPSTAPRPRTARPASVPLGLGVLKPKRVRGESPPPFVKSLMAVTEPAAVKALPPEQKDLRRLWRKRMGDRANNQKLRDLGLPTRGQYANPETRRAYTERYLAKKSAETWTADRARDKIYQRERRAKDAAIRQLGSAPTQSPHGHTPTPAFGRGGGGLRPPIPTAGAPTPPTRGPAAPPAATPAAPAVAGTPPAPTAAVYTRRHSHPG